MAPLDYVAARLVRRYLPDTVVRQLLRRSLVIKPGLETSQPEKAVQRFIDGLAATGDTVAGRRVLIFGYGGSYGVGLGLLRAGAKHVVLLDPFAEPYDRLNRDLAATGTPYLSIANGTVLPNPVYITVIHTSLGEYLEDGGELADLVISNSVLEHVDGMAFVVPQLARVMKQGGRQFHVVDLRDHFFKYPFEMLCHSETTWRGWLNPGSNLNRLRLRDYERLFKAHFKNVTVEPILSYPEQFQEARPRIRAEFLTGDDGHDAVAKIVVRAS